METEKSCSLAETMDYSFPVYHSNLFFNISLSKTPSCVPTVVNYAYAVLLNATKQSLFCCGLVKSLSLNSVITLVGIAFLVLCATQVLACSSPHLSLSPSVYPWIWESRLYFKCWCLNLRYWKTQGKKPGSYCFHELYSYRWKLRNEEV